MRLATSMLGCLFLIASVACAAAVEKLDPHAPVEVVVLLHGLGRTDRAMRHLEERLSEAGYTVHNVRYPSRELPPDGLDAYLHERVVSCCSSAPRLHFVTHSLGGILVRAYLAEHETPNLGRVVMLAPPNRGSEIVDLFGDSALFRWVLGPTGFQLGTDPQSLPNRLPPLHFEVGVIAGTRSINPLGSLVVPGESDGTVSIRSTKLEGMSDFIAVPESHTLIMRSEAAGLQVIEFLEHGRFKHPGP